MAQWYYNLNGYMKGPVRQKEVQSLIHDGVLSSTDIIYRDGADEWKPIKYYPEFDLRASSEENIHQFVGIPEPEGKLKRGQWMVLVRKQSDQATEFVQLGPMPMPEIRSKLVMKELKLSDHIWQPGMTRWTRLGALPEFDRRSQPSSRAIYIKYASIACLVAGAALAISQIEWPIPEGSTKSVLKKQDVALRIEPPAVTKETRPLKKKVSDVLAEKKSGPQSKSEQSKSVLVPKPAPKKEVRKKPKPPPKPVFQLATSARDRNARRLRFRLNESTSRRVQVVLESTAGETLAQKAYYKRIEWRRKAKDSVLNLKSYRVPEGYYRISVQAGSLKDSARLFFGNRKLFKSQLRKKFKRSSFAAQIERDELLSQLRRHSKLFDGARGSTLPAGWKKRWNALNTGRLRDFRRIRASSYFYPKFWEDLRGLRQDVRGQAFQYGGRVDAQAMRRFENRLVVLIRGVQNYSIWKPVTSRNL